MGVYGEPDMQLLFSVDKRSITDVFLCTCRITQGPFDPEMVQSEYSIKDEALKVNSRAIFGKFRGRFWGDLETGHRAGQGRGRGVAKTIVYFRPIFDLWIAEASTVYPLPFDTYISLAFWSKLSFPSDDPRAVDESESAKEEEKEGGV